MTNLTRTELPYLGTYLSNLLRMLALQIFDLVLVVAFDELTLQAHVILVLVELVDLLLKTVDGELVLLARLGQLVALLVLAAQPRPQLLQLLLKAL